MENPLIYYYRHKINDCNEDIERCRNKITKNEGHYDSLILFKASVEKHEESFMSLSQGKGNQLKELDNLRKNSKSAEEYYQGMNDLTINLGVNKVGKVHGKMKEFIKKKLEDYKKEIEKNENKINVLNNRIEWYRAEIERLK